MASHDSEVVRKADTIIAQADKVGNVAGVKGPCFQNRINYRNLRVFSP